MIIGTIYLTISQIVFVVTNFILHIFLGRRLGPEMYGTFGVISAFIFVIEYMILKGFYETLSKFIAEKEEATNAIVTKSIRFASVLSIFIGLSIFFSSGQIAHLINDHEFTVYIKMFSLIIPIVSISTVYFGALNGLRAFGKQALIHMLFCITRLAAIYLLVISGYSIKGAIAGLIIAEIFKLGICMFLYNPSGVMHDINGAAMLKFGFKLMVVALIASLVMNIDLFAVKIILKDKVQTGLYTSAATIAKAGTFLVIPVSLVIIPTISKSISENKTEVTAIHIIQSIRLLAMFILPLSLLVIATSEKCIHIFYGDRFLNASGALSILLIGTIFLSFKAVLYNILIAGSFPGYIICISLFSLLLDMTILFFTVETAGIQAAAAANALTHFTGFILSYYYVSKKFMTPLIPCYLFRIILAAAVIFITANIYSPSGIMLFTYYFLLISVFLLILIFTKEISLKDMKEGLAGLRGVKRRLLKQG